MIWGKKKFSDLYQIPSRNGIYKSKEFHGRGNRIVNMGELFQYDFIRDQEMNRVSLSTNEISKNTLVEGDLLFGRRSLIESGAGKCSIVKNPKEILTFESSIIRVRLNKKIAYPLFYYYYFKSYQGRSKISSIVTGTNVKGIRGSQLSELAIELPPISTQQNIASILSAYDDLIENNLRRIELLERAARLLYEEWFVRLRFPGHESVRIVDGVPEGWEKVKAYDVMDVMSGGTPKTSISEYWDGGIPFYTPKDSTKHYYCLKTEKSISDRGLAKCNSRLYPKDTIFVTARGTVGNLNLAQKPMAMNQSCYALKGKGNLTQLFLFFSLQASIDHFEQRAVGSVFDAIIVDTFKLVPFVLPPKKLIEKFECKIEPIIRQTEILLQQIEKLAIARDLLLPRLMSGEIEV